MLLTREGQNVRLSEDRFEMGRRFTNKIWNAARFVMQNLKGERDDVRAKAPEALEDRWILSRLEGCKRSVTAALESYGFNDAASELYRFVWNDFCDWYLELVKSRLGNDDASARAARGTLTAVLDGTLRMLHPFTPFQTEVLWGALHETLGEAPESDLVAASWPEAHAAWTDAQAESEIEVLQGLVGAVRSIRALTTMGDRKPLKAVVAAPEGSTRGVLEACAERARALAFLEELEIHESAERPPSSAVGIASGFEVFVPLGSEVDLGGLTETLQRRLGKTQKGLGAIEKKLANEGFLRGADPAVIEAEKQRAGELRQEADLLERNLAGLS